MECGWKREEEEASGEDGEEGNVLSACRRGVGDGVSRAISGRIESASCHVSKYVNVL